MQCVPWPHSQSTVGVVIAPVAAKDAAARRADGDGQADRARQLEPVASANGADELVLGVLLCSVARDEDQGGGQAERKPGEEGGQEEGHEGELWLSAGHLVG